MRLDSSGPPGHSFTVWEEREAQLFAGEGGRARAHHAGGGRGIGSHGPPARTPPRRWRRGAIYSVLGIYLSTWTP